MQVLAGTLSRIAGTRLTDTTSGFRGAGPRAVRLFAVHYPAEYLGDTVESLVIALRSGLTVDADRRLDARAHRRPALAGPGQGRRVPAARVPRAADLADATPHARSAPTEAVVV